MGVIIVYDSFLLTLGYLFWGIIKKPEMLARSQKSRLFYLLPRLWDHLGLASLKFS